MVAIQYSRGSWLYENYVPNVSFPVQEQGVTRNSASSHHTMSNDTVRDLIGGWRNVPINLVDNYRNFYHSVATFQMSTECPPLRHMALIAHASVTLPVRPVGAQQSENITALKNDEVWPYTTWIGEFQPPRPRIGRPRIKRSINFRNVASSFSQRQRTAPGN